MADSNVAIQLVLAHEGGFVNNSKDPGGATNWGISKKIYENWVGHDVTAEDVKNMPLDVAKQIYRKRYWEALYLDQVEDQDVANVLMDQGVNRGVPTIAMHLQMVLRGMGVSVAVDGKLGPKTIQALNAVDQREVLYALFVDAQKYYIDVVMNNPDMIEFLPGWIARTQAIVRPLV